MSLENIVLASRRSISPECLVQSVIGVAFRGGKTWLLSPTDTNVCTCVLNRFGIDQFGNTVQLEVFYCFAGKFLDTFFPAEQDFEIFRLHFDTFHLERAEDEVYGELLDRWKRWNGGLVQTCAAGLEHLWGGYYADRDGLVAKLQGETWSDLMYRADHPVALSTSEIVKAQLGYIPHPGMDPVFDDDYKTYIYRSERLMRGEKKSVRPM